MRFILLSTLALLGACATATAPAPANCPPPGWDRTRLEALKAGGFVIEDAQARRALATSVAACVASPDPFLRDGVAFEGLSTLLRGRQLDVATQTELVNDMLPRLQSPDPQGFERPFAALVLSELVRAERLNGHFTDGMRADVVDRSIAYMREVRDYRGFREGEGWRHGVAHGADLLMQLSLNESTGREDLIRIRDAVASQVSPEGHFYTYGEPERLARPILVMAQRGAFTEDEWSTWFAQVSSPAPLASWSDAFSSQAGLARKHNVSAFVNTIWINARLSQNPNVQALLPGAEAALRALP
jgi:hypothetical protein